MTDTADAEPVDPRTHKWWLTSRRGEHGRDCRQSPGGPDHTTTERSTT